MKRLIAILLGAVVLAGCDVQAIQEEKTYRTPNGTVIYEVCIDGVVYLVFQGFNKGGITPKINEEFYPYTCQQEKR